MYQNSQVAQIERDVKDTLENCIEVSVDDYKNLKFADKIVGKIMRIVAPLM
jgi:cardiolipin synthase